MTSWNEPLEPSFQQALASLALFIEQGFSQQNQKLDILTDQIGHFTEGLTELRMLAQEQTAQMQQQTAQMSHITDGLEELKALVQEQSATAKQQAEAAKQQADTVKILAESVASLVALASQKGQA
ncbi:MAG: hypothetical protein ACAF41_19575 [Leptolyngbya sp. BL-A-14]